MVTAVVDNAAVHDDGGGGGRTVRHKETKTFGVTVVVIASTVVVEHRTEFKIPTGNNINKKKICTFI